MFITSDVVISIMPPCVPLDNIQIELSHFQLVLEQNDVVHQCVLFVCGEWDSWLMILHLNCRIESPSLFSLPCILNPSSILLSIWLLLCLCVRHVFCLSGGQCYCKLSFATPRNGLASDHENKPCGGPPIFKITTPIRITISKHFLGWCCTEL